MIELDDFKTVLAVVEAGGILKAAESLHRVPSAVSMRVQNLENRLGVQLFEKKGRKLFATSHALSLAEDARKVLSLVRDVESRMTNEKPGGTLRLGATDNLAGTRLTEPISRLIKAYPSINLELKVASSERIKELIFSHELDAGLVLSYGQDKGMACIPLLREKLVVITKKNDPSIKGTADITKQTVMAFHTSGPYYNCCLAWFAHMGQMPERVIELPSYSAIIGSVAAGLGVSIVPLHWLEQFSCLEKVSIYPLPESLSYMQIDFVHRKMQNSPNLKALKEVLLSSENI